MSKGIIVIDIPETCGKCKMRFDNECSGMFECFLSSTMEVDGPEKAKPDWCPIKELPVRLEELNCPHSMSDYQKKGFSRGWNACLGEIEEEV